MPERVFFLATRGSALALAQTNLVLAQCRAAFGHLRFEIKIIKTTGDKLQTASLTSANLPKGLFTKELEMALLSGEADLAVHSLKDLPTELPAGLKLGGAGKRADPRDVLIYRDAEFLASEPNYDWAGTAEDPKVARRGFAHGVTIAKLPEKAVVATSSTRRSAQLLERRPDLKIVPIRGNVGTRLNKLAAQGELDAILLAAAGLERLRFQIDPDGTLHGENLANGLLATPIDPAEMLPCVGQAALGFEIRENDPQLQEICDKLNDVSTMQCVQAERAFLKGMGGGCQIPVGAYAEVKNNELTMRAVSFLADRPRRAEGRGPATAPEELGQRLAVEIASRP
jgi:hydroxymethylbilane synthase